MSKNNCLCPRRAAADGNCKSANGPSPWGVYSTATTELSVGHRGAVNRVWGKAVQTDAKISPANYGGPLVDLRRRVMGVLVPMSPQETGEWPAWMVRFRHRLCRAAGAHQPCAAAT